MTPHVCKLLATALCLASPVPAADYFVSTQGSDAANGSASAPWRTVTHAAQNAPNGSRILVAAGVYGDATAPEGIEISGGKKLEIVGAGMGRTTLRANAGFSRSIPYLGGSRTWTAAIAVHGTGTVVDLRGLTLDAGHVSATRLACAIYTDGAGGELEAVEMRDAGAVVPDSAQGHVGFIAVGKSGTETSAITLERCLVRGWNKTGVLFLGAGLTGRLLRSEVRGHGLLDTGAAAQNAVQVEEGARYEIVGNVIRDVWYEPSSLNAVGILVYDPAGAVEVRDNQILHCKTAVWFYTQNAQQTLLRGNRIGNCGWGLSVESTGLTANGNDIDSVWGVHARNNSLLTFAGNRYSDFTSNPGYPSRYVAYGNTANQDTAASSLDRGFRAPVAISQGNASGPNDIAVGDFDGDGFSDFVAVHQLGNNVRFHYGGGGTNFSKSPPRDFPIPGGPIRCVAGEFSGNPGLDVAVLSSDGTLRILSNLGNSGNFNVGPALDLDGPGSSAQVTSLATAQLDGTGEDDLIIGYAGDRQLQDGGIWLIWVRKALPVRGSTLPGSMRSIQDVAAVDVDGDQRADVVAIDTQNFNGAPNSVRVWRQAQTTGTFLAPALYPIRPRGARLALAELGSDGRPELLVTCRSDPGYLHVFSGQNDGSFVEVSTSPIRLAPDPDAIQVADLQGDSGYGGARKDVIIAHPHLDRLSLLRSFGPLAMEGHGFQGFTSLTARTGPSQIALRRLDPDAYPDLLVLDKIDGNVDVHMAMAEADNEVFGAGCPGSLANTVPDIYTYGDVARLQLGNPSFGVGLGRAAANSAAVLAMGLVGKPGDVACTVRVDLFFWLPVTATDAKGVGRVPIGPIPNDVAFLSIEMFGQFFVLDSLGGLGGAFSTTAGLRMRVGR